MGHSVFKKLVPAFIALLVLSSISLNAQQCFVEIQRISDTSVKLVATGNSIANNVSGNILGCRVADFFAVAPTGQPVISNNTLAFNACPVLGSNINFGNGLMGFGTGGCFNNGALMATGELTLTYPDGVISATGSSIPLNWQSPGNIICTPNNVVSGTTPPPPPPPAAPIPTMGQWALFILGIIMTSMAVVTIRKMMLATA